MTSSKPKYGLVEVGEAADGETPILRSFLSPDKLIDAPIDDPSIKVVADILPAAAKRKGDFKGFAWRDTIRIIEEEKVVDGKTKKWKYFELSDFKYLTVSEFYEQVKQVGAALASVGFTHETNFNIYSATSLNWQLFAQACAYSGVTFATAYDSLGEDGLKHSINQPEVHGIFTNGDLLPTLAKVIDDIPTLKTIIYDGKAEDASPQALETLRNAREDIVVYHLDEFKELGQKNPVAAHPTGPEDTYCIMYTSGSTGSPKGVIITNKNVVATIGAAVLGLGDLFEPGGAFLAYLPLAHIMEFVIEVAMIHTNMVLGYGTVKTLTDVNVRNCVGDIKAFKPTLLLGVPAVFELIRKGIENKVKAGGAVKSSIFNAGMTIKKKSPNGFLAGMADSVVFKAVKEGTGGRLRYGFNGGAQISRKTQEFLNIALVTLLQGYGLTETCAMGALLYPPFFSYGSVGLPAPSQELKLVDFPEGGYFVKNEPRQGEVWIRGNSVCKAYYKADDLTKEAFTEDGWFMTGDIGQLAADGTLSIIDRKKNLIKLSGGEYIALERLEAVYRSCAYVNTMALHGDSQASRAMAIVFPHEQNLTGLAKENNISGSFEQLCHNEAIRKLVLNNLNAIGKKAGLKPLESLQTVVFDPEEWNPQNGMLTAAQKLNRKTIFNKHQKEIEAVYP